MTDGEIPHAVARLLRAYLQSLRFGPSTLPPRRGSPYEAFLRRNGLPRAPVPSEPKSGYPGRLLADLRRLRSPAWIGRRGDSFRLHEQEYRFGSMEFAGLVLFLTSSQTGGSGCVACHPPPEFSDYRFHNDGAAQAEYDALHGAGTFATLAIPDLSLRNRMADEYLPASTASPRRHGRFRRAPSLDRPGDVDLGVWNVFANPEMPAVQARLSELLCGQFGLAAAACRPESVLPLTVGYMKTPSLRDLGQSAPYLHSGAADTVVDVLRMYQRNLDLVRSGELRNASPELHTVRIRPVDVEPLRAFLMSLNEDYH